MTESAGRSRGESWLRQAGHDLDDAAFGASGARHALACFLAHQAAEKAVTAFLYFSGAESVWGHALADLCEDALTFDPSFEMIRAEAALLDRHYLGARYPSTLPGGVPWEAYEGADAERALQIARAVVLFAEERIVLLGS